MIDHASAGRLLDALAAALISFDGDAWVDLFTPEGVFQRDPFEPALTGSNALRAELHAAALIEEQVEFTWERHWVVPPTILAPWRMSYIQRQSRARVSLAGFATFEIADDGRVAWSRWWQVRRETPKTG